MDGRIEETLAKMRALRVEREGASDPPDSIPMERCFDIVQERAREVYGEPAATDWLYTPNDRLAGARPVDLVTARGETGADDVLDVLDDEEQAADH